MHPRGVVHLHQENVLNQRFVLAVLLWCLPVRVVIDPEIFPAYERDVPILHDDFARSVFALD